MRFRAIVAVTALLSASCGARWTAEQREAVLARTRQGPSGGSESSVEAPTAQAGPGDQAGGPEAAIDRPVGEQGTRPVGPGSGLAPGHTLGQTSDARPCTAPSRETGVTDREIVLGSISSLSGPVPGLGASAAAAVRAYVALRNAGGGVCGRKLVLREADDGTDAGTYRAALRSLASKVLGIAGGFAVGDIGSEEVIQQLEIPIVNVPTGRTGSLRWVFDMNPDLPRPDMVIGKYRWLYEQGARKVAMAYTAVEQSRIEANVQRRLMEAAGLRVVHVNELPLTTLSYDSAARAAANSGADYLWFVADTNGQASMARSVDETGYQWKVKEFSYTTYGTNFIELAGRKAAEGVTSWLRSLPTEEAASNRAMAEYVAWMDRVARGTPKDLFSIDSFVSARAFVEAVEALPGPISREAIVRQLLTVHHYDAGGMFAPIDLGRELSKGCFVGMIVRDGSWHRLAPGGGGYLC